ncbi:AEC family transporter [Bifidobacterium gallicum]|uniref:Permease n=1 Tax=Bifidobacterium gallicum DSM 20093 = LMG 11596 TaxID=561180 RepID=D1NS78_9BIFI|nr:AEC family transporter [Bifidobacterium gallicum]EFA23530.1 transporter, auxin efflux carrier (AEC) family protein [Bifidobacterium gallicum DSM 20093 = LMG 11596]KFI58605.1 permease [Bifidobacterium gallicum DSM 20093 = LMG 11596]
MGKIIITDIVPIIVIMALGYVCGKFHYFDNDQRQGLNKVVLNIALPAALFISIVKATRGMLAADLTLTILGFVGIIVMFMLSYFLCKLMFKHNTQEAAVCALIAGSPTIGFLGFAVLDPIYGNTVSTNLVIAIISIVVNAVTIPIGMYLINLGQARDNEKLAMAAANKQLPTAAPAKGDVAVDPTKDPKTDKDAEISVAASDKKGKAKRHIKNKNVAALVNALEQPVCWAPILAIIIVLIGIRIPDQVAPTFDLIAKANSGVAVLAAGLALSTVKFSFGWETIWNTIYRLLITPAAFLGVGLLCGMGHDINKLAMLVLSVALPPAFSGIIISSRYNIYVKEGASTTAVSTVAFAVTCLLWIWLVPKF